MKVYHLRDANAEDCESSLESSHKAVPRVPSLLFDCDLEDKGLEAARGDSTLDTEGVRRVKVYSEPWSHAEWKLADLVKAALKASIGEVVTREGQVASYVGARGYSVTLKTALGGRSNTECLKNLRHTFLTCTQHTWPHTQHFIIDLNFREQFEICRPTAQYAEALAVVPEVFVGAEERLLALVEVLNREITAAFEEAGTPLPPWRQLAAMLSKWRPRRSQDVCLPCRRPGSLPSQTPLGGCDPRPSPFAPHAGLARSTFANISNNIPAALTPADPKTAAAKEERVRPKSSLLAASLQDGSGALPLNVTLPDPRSKPPLGSATIPVPTPTTPCCPLGHGQPLTSSACSPPWALSSSAVSMYESGFGTAQKDLTMGGSKYNANGWASSLLDLGEGRDSKRLGLGLLAGF